MPQKLAWKGPTSRDCWRGTVWVPTLDLYCPLEHSPAYGEDRVVKRPRGLEFQQCSWPGYMTGGLKRIFLLWASPPWAIQCSSTRTSSGCLVKLQFPWLFHSWLPRLASEQVRVSSKAQWRPVTDPWRGRPPCSVITEKTAGSLLLCSLTRVSRDEGLWALPHRDGDWIMLTDTPPILGIIPN